MQEGLAINNSAKIADWDKIFDLGRHPWYICWCLYNVIVVEWGGNVAYRTGIGKIHIQAFDGACPERKQIVLG
jgi:hypothetical protein